MPALENRITGTDHRSLTRRAARSQAVIGIARATLPGQMVLRLRRSAERMADLVEDVTAPASDRVSAAKALVSVQAQLLDLIGWTKRPASSPGGKRAQVLVDVSPSGLPPADLDNV